MKSDSKRNAARGMIIDHEPVSTSQQTKPEKTRTVFGKRVVQLDGSGKNIRPENISKSQNANAITDGFFASSSPNSPHIDIHADNSRPSNERVLVGVGLALTIAFTLPVATIYLSNSTVNPGIDPITTSSTSQSRLKVHEVSMTRVLKAGGDVVTVLGKLTNNSNEYAVPGNVEIRLFNEHGMMVQQWQYRMGVNALSPGQSLQFRTSAIDTSGQGRNATATIRDMTEK